MNPINEIRDEEWSEKLVNQEQDANRVELREPPSVDIEQTFHEGKLVVLVLLSVTSDLFLEKFDLVASLDSIRQLSILLKTNRLCQGAVKERLGVAMSDLRPEASIFAHKHPLEHLVLLLAFVLLFCHICRNA